MDSFQTALHPAHIGLIFIIYIVHRLVLWPWFLSPLRHIPTPSGADPLTGHGRILARDESGAMLREWVKCLGPVIRLFGPFGSEILVFVHANHLNQLMGKGRSDYDYPRHPISRRVYEVVTGRGLLAVTGNEHRLMKKALRPAFSLANLQDQMHMHHFSTDQLVVIFKHQIDSLAGSGNGKVIPVYDWISKATLDIVCETGFGYRPDSLRNPDSEMSEAYHKLTSLQSGPNFGKSIAMLMIPGVPKLLESSWLFRHRRWLVYLRFKYIDNVRILIESMYTVKKVVSKMLQEKMDDLVPVRDSDANRDIMSILVCTRETQLEAGKTESAMSDDTMVDQALTFLGAGHETTASGLSWVLWSLANDQASQQRLRKEVTPLLRVNTHPDYSALKGLKWLDCVIMEGMRVFPPAPNIARIANTTNYIGDVLVPKGTNILIPIHAVNTYEGTWGKEAEQFKPNRWLDLPKEYNPDCSMLTFSAGTYACIGKTMAIMEMKAMLATLIANFIFEPAYDGQVAKPGTAITMKPTDGMPLLVKCVNSK